MSVRVRSPRSPGAWPALLAVLAGCVAVLGCRGMTSERPPIHPQQNMDFQKRLDPQEDWGVPADGRAMREPVPGTVPRSTRNIGDEHLMTGRVGDAFAEELPEGIALDRRLLTRGRERYEIYCTPCHDSAGMGRGSVVVRGMLPPPSLHDDRLRAFPLGQFVDVMTNGIRNMPSYAAQIPVEDRWAIAAYVRALQLSRATSIENVPAAVREAEGWQQLAASGGAQQGSEQ